MTNKDLIEFKKRIDILRKEIEDSHTTPLRPVDVARVRRYMNNVQLFHQLQDLSPKLTLWQRFKEWLIERLS